MSKELAKSKILLSKDKKNTSLPLLVLILTVVDDFPVGMFLNPLLVHLNDA